MDRNVLIAVILAVLVLISGVQSFQLSEIKEKVATGEITGLSSISSGSQAAVQQSAPVRTSAPAMVGGC